MMIETLQIGMSVSLFLLGIIACIAGMWMILAKRYQQTLKNISAQSARVSGKALTDAAIAPLIEAMSGLVKAIDQLVRTSAGVGVFLCLVGAVLCFVAFRMLSTI